ncbi:MAG: winged helix-turn-helix domain-containing protein [Planctomycetota bacterium]|jgi:molybdate transport system regulatory protein
MGMLWVICGAGRGVGKTTLALKLCEILPDSRYAKCGHGAKQSQKPDPFFEDFSQLEAFIEDNQDSCEHLVIESNTLARAGRGDMIVFIDGVEGKTDFREDAEQLQEKAHLRLCRKAKATEWKKRLSDKIASASVCNKVCDVLVSQKQYLFGLGPKILSKIWFESAGEHTFGMGLANLLENVARLGTLQAAAKESGMSYRYAWDLIRVAEKHLAQSLIERHAGGADGGGSVLSDHGHQMLKGFRQINEEVAAYADTRFEEFFNGAKANAAHK